MLKTGVQTALVCGCGSLELFRGGYCRRCERRARHNREKFEGLREAALRRDDSQCQVCGEVEPARVLVHHRRPGLNRLRFFITLCRSCHVRIHHTYRPGFGFGGLLRELWREVNRGPEQRPLPLAGGIIYRDQLELFAASALWLPREHRSGMPSPDVPPIIGSYRASASPDSPPADGA